MYGFTVNSVTLIREETYPLTLRISTIDKRPH